MSTTRARVTTLLRVRTVLHLLRRCLVLALLLGLLGASGGAGQGDGEAAPAEGGWRRQVDVGVILDRKTWLGNTSWACMEMALEDFYANASHYRTRLRLHLRDIGTGVVDAASASVDLLKNARVQAIIGPQTSAQAKFLTELGNKSSVPIISFSSSSPSRSPKQTPYFIRTAWNDSSQAEAIAALVQKYNWREVVPVFEDDDSNTRFIPDLVDALKQVDTRVSYRCKIQLLATMDEIKGAIVSLKLNWTSVFIVRMSHPLALKFFQLAKGEGMMAPGFVWIIAYGLTDIFDVVGSQSLDVMQGVLGVQPHVPDTEKLQKFRQRWQKRYQLKTPVTLSQPTVSGLYAYDTIWALALAAEETKYVNSDFGLFATNNASSDFDRIGSSKAASKLRDIFLSVNFLGMSGKFRIQDMQLLSANYVIIKIIGQERRAVGLWTPIFGISNDTVIWPGPNDIENIPRGWLFPTNKTLNIGVPVKSGFGKFIRSENHFLKGFCIEVFEKVVHALPYQVNYKYHEFQDDKGQSNGTYDELVYKVYLKEYDAVVGDITILANRSSYVDFTLPYAESGVRMLVPVRDRRQKTAWTFLMPLTAGLWLGTGAFFIFTGFVVWFIEHRTNPEFRGLPVSQIGSVFYFSFSTLIFAHRERIVNNLSRITVVVWLFVVLIVQQSYTASLSSMLTVEQLQPTVTNLDEVIRKGSNVGYLNDSFLPGLLKRLKIDESKMIPFDSSQEYNEALSTGRVAVIIDEIPYLKVFLSQYCDNYTMIGPTYKFDGFGFAFPRGSPLTSDISREILRFTSGPEMVRLEKDLYDGISCPDKDDSQTSSSLTLHSFMGLFIITGACSILALILHVLKTLYDHRRVLSDASQSSSGGWLVVLSKIFHGDDTSSNTPNKNELAMVNVDSTTESPLSMTNHIVEHIDSDTDTESQLGEGEGEGEGEGTPGREVSARDSEPSFAYMHSEMGNTEVPTLSRNASTIRWRQRSMERTPW